MTITEEAPKGFDSKYTIDHHDIFCVPPNSKVLHAANEVDFKRPDVFGLGYSRLQCCSCEVDKPEPQFKPSISVDQAIERCDSASSQIMSRFKPDKDKTVSGADKKPAKSFSIRKFLAQCFNKK